MYIQQKKKAKKKQQNKIFLVLVLQIFAFDLVAVILPITTRILVVGSQSIKDFHAF